MTVRDLGYRAYEGELLPASHNTWVLVRYGIARIWASWINKLVVFGALLPLLGFALVAGIRFATFGREIPELPPGGGAGFGRWFLDPDAASWLRSLTATQFWFFVTVVTLRSGASIVAEDYTHRAYQFYFAKPVTPLQYLVGRAGALAIFLFALVFGPTLLLTIVLAGTGPEERLWPQLGLILPAFLDAAIIAVSCALLSVAASSISKSRALTIMAWGAILFVPTVLALLVEGITESEWVWLISPPGLLWIVGDALYKVHQDWEHLSWYHAAPVLALLTGGGTYLAFIRIRKAEVIT
jgi:hypothetical protein